MGHMKLALESYQQSRNRHLAERHPHHHSLSMAESRIAMAQSGDREAILQCAR